MNSKMTQTLNKTLNHIIPFSFRVRQIATMGVNKHPKEISRRIGELSIGGRRSTLAVARGGGGGGGEGVLLQERTRRRGRRNGGEGEMPLIIYTSMAQ